MFVGDNDHGNTKPTYYHKEFDSRVAVLEDRLEHVMTDRNNLELRVDELVRKTEELELALSVAQVENNELNELLAEADDNVMWLSNDVSIAEEELHTARNTIRQLETQLRLIREGFEGCCHVCEPVGALNQELRDENAKLRRHMRSLQNYVLDRIVERDEELGLL